jgi:hypothetical protein
MSDLISRQAAIDAIDEISREVDDGDGFDYAKWRQYFCELPPEHGTNLAEVGTDAPDINVGDINKFIDSLEEIFADIRERHVDDSVCGLCEYDGAYIGQSGDWCNECPGFDRDDCFKLSDKCRKRWIDTITKALPSAQPKRGKWHYSNGKPATIGRSFGVICDQCGTESEYCTNFCGECGADMREVTE